MVVICYLDEDVKAAIAEQLTVRGVATHTTQGEGRKGTRDHEQLWFAAQREWTFVTNNRRDFRELHGAWRLWQVPRNHAGILVLVQGMGAAEAARVIAELCATQSTLTNFLYDWRHPTGWSEITAFPRKGYESI